MRSASILLVALLVSLSVACYPVRVLQQPKLVFEVRDPGGKPIADAVVHLARHPDGRYSFASGVGDKVPSPIRRSRGAQLNR